MGAPPSGISGKNLRWACIYNLKLGLNADIVDIYNIIYIHTYIHTYIYKSIYLSIYLYVYHLEHGGAPERQRGEELEMREPERKRSLHLRQRGRLALKQRVSSGSFLRPTHKTGPDNKKTVTKRAT